MLHSSLLPRQDGAVRLRRLQAEDAYRYAEGANDAEVRRYGHLPEPEYTPELVRAMIVHDVDPALKRGDLAVLTIADSGSDLLMGSLVLYDITADSAEVGFWVHPEHRGRGIAVTALQLASGFAADSGLIQLRARTIPENVASCRVLKAGGFLRVGSAVEVAPSGRRVELLHYVRDVGS